MAYRKVTLRRMPPETRKVARLINEVESVITRLKNRLPEITSLELDSQALLAMNKQRKEEPDCRYCTELEGYGNEGSARCKHGLNVSTCGKYQDCRE